MLLETGSFTGLTTPDTKMILFPAASIKLFELLEAEACTTLAAGTDTNLLLGIAGDARPLLKMRVVGVPDREDGFAGEMGCIKWC